MDITTAISGTSARITPRGEIDHDTLPSLRAAADALPARVTDVTWNLRHTPFMDVAGRTCSSAPPPSTGPTAGRR
ncbi:STAS domain-containing protein [Streptomyces longwoodensis]|uniref:STAS domain-containing protein n=1 Tax=Streptomyces longwoodensis TaxID=68231 RepID=UPI0033C544F8